MNVIKTLTTSLPSIVGLISGDGDTLWIYNSRETKLQKVKIESEISLINEVEDVKVYDITRVMDNDGFLLSVYSDHTISMLTDEGHVKPLTSIVPYLSLGIHVTKDKEILVGFQENALTFPITEKSRRGIVKLGTDRKVKFRYEFDETKRRLFTCPYRITTNINKDICVCDIITADNSGRIVILGDNGLIKWSYIGHPTINGGWNKFNPEGIATTSTGDLVITDCNNHAIHVLSKEGELILCQLTRQLDFIAPCSIDIHHKDELRIGCSSIQGEKDAKIIFIRLNTE